MWTQVSRPTVLAGMVLLLAALVLIFLPVIKTGIGEISPDLIESKIKSIEIEKTTSATVAAEPALAPPVSTNVSVSQPASLSAVTATVATAEELLLAKSSVSMTVSSPVPASASKFASAGASSPTFVVTASPPPATDVVVFTAKTESWVEATDAKGQVVLRRVLATGEVAGASGLLPLKVVVGRANATQVEIRGKAFDVNAIAKDNVARFEVK